MRQNLSHVRDMIALCGKTRLQSLLYHASASVGPAFVTWLFERWWELVSCAYLLVSLQSPVFQHADDESQRSQPATVATPPYRFSEHRWWDLGQGWKNILNNLRLILQPYVYYCLLLPWLLLFDIPGLRAGFLELISSMNLFHATLPT